MKEITHRVDEDQTRRFPAQWEFQEIFMQSNLEAVPVSLCSHSSEPVSHALRIAMRAPLADLRATCHRVPSHLGPFNMSLSGHEFL